MPIHTYDFTRIFVQLLNEDLKKSKFPGFVYAQVKKSNCKFY